MLNMAEGQENMKRWDVITFANEFSLPKTRNVTPTNPIMISKVFFGNHTNKYLDEGLIVSEVLLRIICNVLCYMSHQHHFQGAGVTHNVEFVISVIYNTVV